MLKCHRYWPDPDQQPAQDRACQMGEVEVEFVSAVSSAAWITRKFSLRKDGKERFLTQLSYEAWPDHGVPLTSREFLTFRHHVKTVEEVRSRFERPPSRSPAVEYSDNEGIASHNAQPFACALRGARSRSRRRGPPWSTAVLELAELVRTSPSTGCSTRSARGRRARTWIWTLSWPT